MHQPPSYVSLFSLDPVLSSYSHRLLLLLQRMMMMMMYSRSQVCIVEAPFFLDLQSRARIYYAYDVA